jgi:hypothetical protein
MARSATRSNFLSARQRRCAEDFLLSRIGVDFWLKFGPWMASDFGAVEQTPFPFPAIAVKSWPKRQRF